MITEAELQELLAYQPAHPVLSVYLNTEPAEGSADAYRLRLRNMLKDIIMPDDVAAVERYFAHTYNWSGRSVAVFSCAPEGFLRAFSLAVPVRDRLRVGDHPHVKPLADVLDSFGGYGVALVDKQGARMFYFHMGELREQEGVLGETVRRIKRGGASAVAGRRGGVAGQTHYAEEVAGRNMKEAAEFAARFFAENNVRRVLIGGTEDNVAAFRSQLPKAWQSLVVGAFPMSMTASKEEVLERSMQVGHEAEHRREEILVENLITRTAKRHGGITGLDGALAAVHDGRVQTLIIRDGYRAPGYRCKGCGYVTTKRAARCSYCGGAFEHIGDAVEMAVHKVMQQGGEVEVLHEEPVTQDFGSIGALLRY